MKRSLSILTAAGTILLGAAGARAAQYFILSDHPDGALNPQDYGLRFDGLLTSATNFSMSVSTDEGAPKMYLRVNDTDDEIRIFGKASHNNALYDIDFTYNVHVAPTSDGWTVTPAGSTPTENHGTITGPGLNGLAFFDEANHWGLSFDFRADGHRLAGDNSTWVGRGWVTTRSDHGSVAATQDWLFIGAPTDDVPPDDNPNTGGGLPEPATAAMGLLGLGALSLATRRRAH